MKLSMLRNHLTMSVLHRIKCQQKCELSDHNNKVGLLRLRITYKLISFHCCFFPANWTWKTKLIYFIHSALLFKHLCLVKRNVFVNFNIKNFLCISLTIKRFEENLRRNAMNWFAQRSVLEWVWLVSISLK